MKQYFINEIEVSEKTYFQYLNKEFKRVKCNCKDFDCTHYKVHNKIILKDIKFEIVENKEVEAWEPTS